MSALRRAEREAANVHVDRSGAAVVVVAPDLGEAVLRPGADRVLDQKAKQLVLHEGEIDGLGSQRWPDN